MKSEAICQKCHVTEAILDPEVVSYWFKPWFWTAERGWEFESFSGKVEREITNQCGFVCPYEFEHFMSEGQPK